MPVTAGRKLAVYLLLSHPYSVVKRKLDFLTPEPTLAQAATDVVDLLNRILKLNLDPQSQDYIDLQTLLTNPSFILQDPHTNMYRITSDPGTLAIMDDYDPILGCPSCEQAADIYADLS